MTHYWFISKKLRRGSKLALFTFCLAFVVILLGAYTRLTNAGLSCPDWPHCYGFITAPFTSTELQLAAQKYPNAIINVAKAWTEMVHRYFAGTEGILIIILAIMLFKNREVRDKKSIIIGVALLALLCLQVSLGMLTVTQKLNPVIVLSHLLTGISILSLLWWAYLNLQIQQHITKSTSLITPMLWLALIIVGTQVTLGGWVTTHYAGLACIDFPYCNGKIIPTLHLNQFNTDLITIHMMHRIGALITATYIGILAFYLLTQPAFRSIAKLLLALIALQITLGILNIIWLRPVWIALIHHAVAILLLLSVITALVKSYFVTRDYRYGASYLA